MKQTSWKKRMAIGIMSVAVLTGGVYTSNELQKSQPDVAEQVGASKAVKFKKTTYQTTYNLNMRSGASTKHKVLVTIPKGAKVSSDTRVGNWYKVSYKGKTGYVSGSYLKKVSSTSTATSYYHTKKSVAIKSGKSQKNKTLTTVSKGKTLILIQRQGSWAKVKYGKTTGYVPFSDIQKGKAPVAKPTYKQMTRAQAEKHLSGYMKKKGNSFVVASVREDDPILEAYFKQKSSAKAGLVINTVFYSSMYEIKPGDFGRKIYDESKKMLNVTNSAIKRYAETQLGVNTKESRQLIAEAKKSITYTKNVNKTVTIGGKKFKLNGGVGSFEISPL